MFYEIRKAMSIKYTKQSRIFKDFRSIAYSDYYYLIRYYEQHHKEIKYLPLEEAMVMSFYYTNALFKTEEYNILIPYANELLENTIINNINYIDGIDIYTTVLFQKTFAHLQLGATDKAINLAKQLIGIDWRKHHHISLLSNCYLMIRPKWVYFTLIASSFATIIAAVVIIIFTALHSYIPDSTMLVPYSLLLLAGLGLVASAMGHYLYVEFPIKKVVKMAKSKKRY